MRKTSALLLAGALGLGAASTASAITWSGVVADPACAAGADLSSAELYIWKLKPGADVGYTDLQYDLRNKGGSNIGDTTIQSPPQWQTPGNFREAAAGTDVVFTLVTFDNGDITYNSGEQGVTGGDLSFTPRIPVGTSWPAAEGSVTPIGLGAAAGNPAINLTWGLTPEVAGASPTFGVGCHVAGLAPDPTTGGGIFAGYNVYRLANTGGTPTTQDFYDATLDGDPATGGFQYFAPMGAFDLTVGDPDTGPGMGGGDPLPVSDLAGLNNPDAMAWTGDEQAIFQDGPGTQRGGRSIGVAPSLGSVYWYAVQPVVGRADTNAITIGDLASATLGTGTGVMPTGMDVVTGGGIDSADVDNDGTIDFFSPQADFGIGGFGLTHGSLPLLSPPTMIDFNAFGVGTEIELEGDFSGGDVELAFTAANESGDVLGYNVYRHHGDVRVPVNEAPVLASGGEGSVYRLVDDLSQVSRRLSRSGSFTYSIDVLYNDGTEPSTVGPFVVEMGGREEVPARRRR